MFVRVCMCACVCVHAPRRPPNMLVHLLTFINPSADNLAFNYWDAENEKTQIKAHSLSIIAFLMVEVRRKLILIHIPIPCIATGGPGWDHLRWSRVCSDSHRCCAFTSGERCSTLIGCPRLSLFKTHTLWLCLFKHALRLESWSLLFINFYFYLFLFLICGCLLPLLHLDRFERFRLKWLV